PGSALHLARLRLARSRALPPPGSLPWRLRLAPGAPRSSASLARSSWHRSLATPRGAGSYQRPPRPPRRPPPPPPPPPPRAPPPGLAPLAAAPRSRGASLLGVARSFIVAPLARSWLPPHEQAGDAERERPHGLDAQAARRHQRGEALRRGERRDRPLQVAILGGARQERAEERHHAVDVQAGQRVPPLREL